MENVTDRSQSIIIDSYIEYYSRVVDFITYRINNRCDAEDLAQDVFIRLMEYKQILCEDTVKHFIYTISRNIVTDYLRRYYKAREISSYLYDETLLLVRMKRKKLSWPMTFLHWRRKNWQPFRGNENKFII